MVLPDAANSARSPVLLEPASRTDTLVPTASAIWDASVRCQTSS
jgi:hypothetical protein